MPEPARRWPATPAAKSQPADDVLNAAPNRHGRQGFTLTWPAGATAPTSWPCPAVLAWGVLRRVAGGEEAYLSAGATICTTCTGRYLA